MTNSPSVAESEIAERHQRDTEMYARCGQPLFTTTQMHDDRGTLLTQLSRLQAELTEAREANATKDALLEKAGEALEPFAVAADAIEKYEDFAEIVKPELDREDFRRARTALENENE